MFDHLGPAMRRALAATRASKLTEATRILQEALAGRPSHEEAQPPGDQRSATPAGAAPRRRGLGETLLALRGGSAAKQRRLVPQPPIPEGAAFLKRSISTIAGLRDYRLFVPSAPHPRGLVVMLHGCKQNAEDFAAGTTMNLVAETEGLLVAYPTQSRAANVSGCWNWFRPEDQRRDAGEPLIIAELTRSLIAEYALSGRVFVAGLSAGGAMAAVMGATYPELYEAIGIHSGLPYRAARDVSSALAAMRGDHRGTDGHPIDSPSASSMPRLIVFHGSRDHTVVPSNATRLIEAARTAHEASQLLERRFICRSRQVEHTQVMGAEGTVKAEAWLIAGAGHHWIGGDPTGSYAKPEGPNASHEMVRFFLGRPLQLA